MRYAVTVLALALLISPLLARRASVSPPTTSTSAASISRADSTSNGDTDVNHLRREVFDGRSPAFETNQGQTDEHVKFFLRSRGSTLFLTDDDVVFAFNGRRGQPQTIAAARETDRSGRSDTAAVHMRFAGARKPASIEGMDPLPGKRHYFKGRDRRSWRTGLTAYSRVIYRSVYPGIDVVFHCYEGRLEYDFVIAPGANATEIRLTFDGANRVHVDSTGSLIVTASGHEIRQPKPYSYQEVDGVRQEVRSALKMVGPASVRFSLGPYDRHRPLTLDPALFYSTYLGGSESEQLFGGTVAVDRAGNAFVAGTTGSPDFPVAGPLNSTYDGLEDAYVTKYDPHGTVVFSAYLGGAGSDGGNAVTTDWLGNVYVAGYTQSSDYPTTPGTIPTVCTPSVDQCVGRGFVTKIDQAGSTLVYSTLFGGGDEAGYPTVASSIVVDDHFKAYIGGATGAGLPATPGAVQTQVAGRFDAFVAKLNEDGSSLMFVSYLGGTFDEFSARTAVDRTGNVYLTGTTYSDDFPTTPGAFQRTCPAVEIVGGCSIAFVAKFNSTATSLVYSTYLGGSATVGSALKGLSSVGSGIAVNAAGQAYVTGLTYTTDFPTTTGSWRETSDGDWDAFVTKFNTNGSSLVFSTYLGGNSQDSGRAIAIDRAGNAYVAGQTFSTDFPSVHAIQANLAGSTQSDAFVTKLSPAGDTLLFSTYLGGSGLGPWPGNESGEGIAVDAAGTVYASGWTASNDFPMLNAAQSSFGGGLTDTFLAKIGERTCGTDVSGQVVVLRSPSFPFFSVAVRLQFVLVFNKSNSPIAGPLVLVEDELQNAVALNFGPTTGCYAGANSPIVFLDAGADDTLAPNEAIFTGLLFYQPESLPISYTPRTVSGIPTQ